MNSKSQNKATKDQHVRHLSAQAASRLPASLGKILQNQQITQDSVIYAAQGDMTLDCQYTQSWAVLTPDALIVCLSGYQEGLKTFSGSDSYTPRGKNRTLKTWKRAVLSRTAVPDEWAVRKISFEEIGTMDILQLVSGGVLYYTAPVAESEEPEPPVQLLAFTNLFMGEMRRLCHVFEKLKKAEDITEEDLKNPDEREQCPKCGALYPEQGRKICPRCMDTRSIMTRLFSYLKPYKKQVFFLVLSYIGIAALNMFYPYLNGVILYGKVLAKDESFLALMRLPAGRFTLLLVNVVLLMALTKVTSQVLSTIQGCIVAKVIPNVIRQIRSDVFASMGRLSVKFYNSRQTGGLMTRVLNDTEEIMGFFFDGLPFLLVNGLTIIATVIVMFSLNWPLAVTACALLPLLFLITFKLLPGLFNLYGRRHRAARSLNSQVNDNLTGARVVKAFGQQRSEEQRFTRYNDRVRSVELDVVRYDNGFYAIFAAVEQLCSFAVWGVGAILMLSGASVEVGLLMTFTGYVTQLQGPLDQLGFVMRWWTICSNSAQRIFEILDTSPDVQEAFQPVRRERLEGSVSLQNVTFGYEVNKPVLHGISFDIPAGQMLGVVGRSGAGKSTLVNLISRLYDPQEGAVYIDGINVKDLAFADLRRSVAMVSQESYIFIGSVAENIAYARPEATRDEIVAAAIAASAHDFICKMPDGYDTILGSSGRQLSGGERQRISIARAILTDPRILILDEATASVDTETERSIQRSIDRLIKGRTTISIAHRLSTLNNADKLVVIDGGHLTESGTHEELVEQKGVYYKLMQLQKKALTMRGLED